MNELDILTASLQAVELELAEAYTKRALSREEDVDTDTLDSFIEHLESDVADIKLRIKAQEELE